MTDDECRELLAYLFERHVRQRHPRIHSHCWDAPFSGTSKRVSVSD